MYIPEHFRQKDNALAAEFIAANNFGMLISNGTNTPCITHLPFFIEEQGQDFCLITHMAKANPQWNQLEKSPECIVVFNGPHGYVSPALYGNRQNVPTWNYMTLHATCTASVIHTPQELRKIMHQTIEQVEENFLQQYSELPDNYLDTMFSAITGLRLNILSIETKFKLSQNKPKEDVKRVADFFERNGNEKLAEWMKKINQL